MPSLVAREIDIKVMVKSVRSLKGETPGGLQSQGEEGKEGNHGCGGEGTSPSSIGRGKQTLPMSSYTIVNTPLHDNDSDPEHGQHGKVHEEREGVGEGGGGGGGGRALEEVEEGCDAKGQRSMEKRHDGGKDISTPTTTTVKYLETCGHDQGRLLEEE